MYADEVTARHLHQVERQTRIKLKRYKTGDSLDRSTSIGALVGKDRKLKRSLTTEERTFVRNECLLSKFDFMYASQRYLYHEYDGTEGGGVGPFRPWSTQELVMDELKKLEIAAFDALSKGFPSDGICMAINKNRQLGMTAFWVLLGAHRQIFWAHTRGFRASIDDSKVHELYKRDKIVYDNLPWFMRPTVQYDVKDQYVSYEGLHSTMSYQKASQESGLGTGQQYDFGHLTEVSQWVNPERIRLDFFDTLPLSPYTLAVLESVPLGRGNWWHDFTEEVRRGEHRRWHWIFVPSYILAKKYSAIPPPGWNPSEKTLEHASKVADTSPDIVGYKVELTREQQYWWETERSSAQKGGELNLFLTNHAATPEESFQHSGQSAFEIDLMDTLRTRARKGVPYQFERFEDPARAARLARIAQ